jgi:hypothetical protein
LYLQSPEPPFEACVDLERGPKVASRRAFSAQFL